MPLNYVVLTVSILQISELNLAQKIILGLVCSLSKGLKINNENIGKIIGVSASHVSHLISDMDSKGYLEIKNPQSKYRVIYLAENDKVNDILLSHKQQSKSDSKRSTLRNTQSTLRKTANISKVSKDNSNTSVVNATGITFVEFEEYWNQHGNLPRILAFTDNRKHQLNVRSQEPVFVKNWKQIIDKLSCSAFHTGQNNRQWRADIDWLLKNDTNYVKILELVEPDFSTREVSEDEADELLKGVL